MNSNVIGEILFKHAGAVYTTPIQRVVDSATFYVNVLQVGGTTPGTLNVDIEHRDEIEDSWATNASFTGITAAGLNTGEWKVRLLFRLRGELETGPSVGIQLLTEEFLDWIGLRQTQ